MLTGKGKLRQEGGGGGRERAMCATGTGLCILRFSRDTCRQKNVWRDTTHSSAEEVPIISVCPRSRHRTDKRGIKEEFVELWQGVGFDRGLSRK